MQTAWAGFLSSCRIFVFMPNCQRAVWASRPAPTTVVSRPTSVLHFRGDGASLPNGDGDVDGRTHGDVSFVSFDVLASRAA